MELHSLLLHQQHYQQHHNNVNRTVSAEWRHQTNAQPVQSVPDDRHRCCCCGVNVPLQCLVGIAAQQQQQTSTQSRQTELCSKTARHSAYHCSKISSCCHKYNDTAAAAANDKRRSTDGVKASQHENAEVSYILRLHFVFGQCLL